MAGMGQPPPAVRPRHLAPFLPGVRGRSAAAATGLPPPPINTVSSQCSPLPAAILHEMFNTCVAKGIVAKLVQKTVDGKVEISLHCSTMTSAAAAAAVSATPKRKRKRPDNERRKMRREAWRQRFSPAAVAAAATSAPCPMMAAAAVPTEPVPVQPAATAAAAPPQAWALEKRDGLIVIARRMRKQLPESPETTRASEGARDLNVSSGSWAEEREQEEFFEEMKSPPTFAAVAAKAPAAAREEWSEEVEREEYAEPVAEAKRCPVCLSSNTNPEKNNFSDFIMCNSCHTIY
jgi:hypothetical protein